MEQVQILSAVCKKLNNDIEALANQTSIRESTLAKLDANQQAYDEQLRQLNIDIQIKLSKTDTIVQKLQSDVEQMSHGVREVMNGHQESNRSNIQRYQDLKLEVKEIFVFFCFL
jgi:outer membrane murein-binding lipoprotein Lpp